jgi:hypothetical protein
MHRNVKVMEFRSRWEDNIKMDLRENGGTVWIGFV